MEAHFPARIFSETQRHPKIVKNGIELNIFSLILHLAPAIRSGYEVCPMRSNGCTAACLNTSGFRRSRKEKARVNRTKLFFEQREEFMERLVGEIFTASEYARKRGYLFGVRLNGTSDIRWETVPVKVKPQPRATGRNWQYKMGIRMLGLKANNLMEVFPDITFYDYTKIVNRKRLPENYHLTFSRSEDNEDACLRALDRGMNVAVVFRDALPDRFYGRPVVNGDISDWRPGDGEGFDGPVIVGLKAKGPAQYDQSGFVV